MRRLLLLIGFLFLLSPISVSAAAPTASGSTATGALSLWVEQVLKKADDGIANATASAASAPSSSCGEGELEQIAQENVSLVRSWVATNVHLAQESELLRERTVCFQSDRMLLLGKIRKVMETMETATKDCDSRQNAILEETFQFLTRSYLSFLQGSMDPTYEDDLLRYDYAFEKKDLWDRSITKVTLTGSIAPLCPFTTDYGPHAIGYIAPDPDAEEDDNVSGFRSYGCDSGSLLKLPASMSGETLPLQEFMKQTESGAGFLFLNIQNALMSLQSLTNALAGGSSSYIGTISLPPKPPHRSVSGCLRPIIPPYGAGYADAIEALLAADPGYFDPKNQSPRNGLSPSRDKALPYGQLFLPSFDFFQSSSNPFILLRRFLKKELAIGLNRPLPAYMLSDETGNIIPMHLIGQLGDLQATQRNGGNAQVMIGSLEASSRDALERMEDLSLPLKSAVSALTNMTETFMPTKYIPDFTFFIARSCVDGPCQKKLETVLQRSLNPYCHPYLSGRYRDADSMKRCFCDTSKDPNDPKSKSIEQSWPDYKKYCTDDYKRQEYEQKEAKLIPACQPEGE